MSYQNVRRVVVILGIVCFAEVLSVYIKENSEKEYKLYTPEDWDALPPISDMSPIVKPVPYVVIHHTYIPGACNTVEQCKAAMRGMQRSHMELEYSTIGYNFCVGSEGGAYEGRGWDLVGIHAKRANNFSIGICLIGDWRTELPPPIQLETTKALIATGVERGVLSPNYKLIGHNQATSTECPGEALLAEIAGWPHYVPGHIVF